MAETQASVILIPWTQFCEDLRDGENMEDDFSAMQSAIKEKVEDIMEREIKEGSRTIIFCDGEVPNQFNDEFVEKHGKLLKKMEDTRDLEDTFIKFKHMIDDLDISTVYLVTPGPHLGHCLQVAVLVFNKLTYTFCFEMVNTGLKTQIKDNDDKEVLERVKVKLRDLPSSDGQPIKTLRSKLLPSGTFYHGYTTRTGGVSTYPTMRSLPLAMSLRKKDTRVYVEENRRRLAEAEGFDAAKFECASAVHGTDIWVLGDEQPHNYDAIITNKAGYTISAPGADCQTLLFCDPVKSVVAAAHSGWKGTVARIQQNVVRVMNERFGCEAGDILVAIGPSIGVCCYNVDESRAQIFTAGVDASVIHRRDGIPYLDQWQATRILLEEVGIKPENIDDGKRLSAAAEEEGCQAVTLCTQCHKDKFFSYRRDGPLFGNQIGFIGIKADS